MFDDVSRVLLLECINADQFPGQIAGILPFLKGWLRQRGIATRWLRYGVSTANLHRHGRDEVTLTADETAVLLDVVGTHRPQLIVTTHPLWDEHVTALRALVPDLDFLRLAALEGNLAWGQDGGAIAPDYRFEAGNAAAARDDRQNVYVLARDGCGYRRAIASNPCYADLRLPSGIRARGCAFCGMKLAEPGIGSERARESVTRQLRAIHADYPAAGRHLNALLLENVENAELLTHALASLDELGMGDVTILVGARTDRLVQSRAVIERWIAERQGTAASIHVFVCGLENFGANELLRMNKGTTPLDGLRAVGLVQELELGYPHNFNYSGYAPFSVILFSPWTTFADLHLNLRLIQHLGIEAQVGNLFMARLRLHPDVAMTYLAERDGLLDDDLDDEALRLNRRKLFREERPWRFRDPRLEPVSRVATRIEPDTAFEGDPLYARIRALQQAHRPPDVDPSGGWRRTHHVAFFLCLVDAARAHDEVLPIERLLAETAALWDARGRGGPPTASRAASGAASGAVGRFRLGAARLPLGAWLRRVAPLVAAGRIHALAVSRLLPGEPSDDDTGALRALGLEFVVEGGPSGGGTLVVGASRADVGHRIALGRALAADAPPEEHRAALEEEAKLLGAPACCAAAWARSAWARACGERRWSGWQTIALRAAAEGPLDGALDPLLVPGLVVPPCRPDCAAAREHLADLVGRLGLLVPSDDRLHVFPLDPAAPDELLLVTPLAREPDGIRYDPEAISDGAGGCDGPLRARLRDGDRLRFVPGQVQLWRGGHLLEPWTAQVGVWDPHGAPDAPFWAELAAAALRRADPEARRAAAFAAAIARQTTVDARMRSPGSDAAAEPANTEVARAPSRGGPQGEGLASRAGTLRISFVDRRRTIGDLVFYVGAVREGEQTALRVGRVGLAHEPCPTGTKAFQLCVRALGAAMRANPTPPGEDDRLAWERVVHQAVARTPLARRFHCSIEQL